MSNSSHGPRHRTRRKLSKNLRTRGKVSIRRIVQEFKEGERVVIAPEPSIHAGMPYRRFIGRQGLILNKQGNAYVVEVKEGKMLKHIISMPVHLRRIG